MKMTELDKKVWNSFLNKLEWDGGIIGMLEYGGPECFPPELQEAAAQVEEALKELDRLLEGYILILGPIDLEEEEDQYDD
jgi:hypothetical protein